MTTQSLVWTIVCAIFAVIGLWKFLKWLLFSPENRQDEFPDHSHCGLHSMDE